MEIKRYKTAKDYLEENLEYLENEQVYVWYDKTEVSMGCIARPTNHGVTITLVYTPKKYRHRGYGTKIVSELSKQMLERGCQFCTLLADMENPSSNNIYQKIGYIPVKEFREIEFIKTLDPLFKS